MFIVHLKSTTLKSLKRYKCTQSSKFSYPKASFVQLFPLLCMYTQSKLLFPDFFPTSALYYISFYPHQLLLNLSVDHYYKMYRMVTETM